MANIATQATANAKSTKVTNNKNREMKKFFSDLHAFIKWLQKYPWDFCKIQNDEDDYLSVSIICYDRFPAFNDIINRYLHLNKFSEEDQERIAKSLKEFFRGIDRTRILDGNYLAFYGRCFYNDEQLEYLGEKQAIERKKDRERQALIDKELKSIEMKFAESIKSKETEKRVS